MKELVCLGCRAPKRWTRVSSQSLGFLSSRETWRWGKPSSFPFPFPCPTTRGKKEVGESFFSCLGLMVRHPPQAPGGSRVPGTSETLPPLRTFDVARLHFPGWKCWWKYCRPPGKAEKGSDLSEIETKAKEVVPKLLLWVRTGQAMGFIRNVIIQRSRSIFQPFPRL